MPLFLLDTAGRRMGAWLLAAIQALNITLTSTAAQSTGAEIYNYIADPLDVQYSYQEMWTDQPTIQIWDDYVTIDGVEYTDIWLSNEAATKFQVNAYDFKSAYNIASNSNGTFAEGKGTVNNVPIFDNGESEYVSQIYSIPSQGTYSIGDFSVATGNPFSGGKYQLATTLNGTRKTTSYGTLPAEWQILVNKNNASVRTREKYANGDGGNINWNGIASYSYSPFDFDWVSETIPAQRQLDPDEGLMMRIPSSEVPELKQFIQDNPEFIEPGGAPIDVNIDPDIMTKLDDLIDIIAPIIPIINAGDIQFTINHEAPIPPIPDTPIIDATVPQVVQPIINEIQNQGDIISQSIPPIIENIPKIDEICNNIDTAPYHDLDTGLDHLPSVFLPFIVDLRSALGIWHYVTEWLSQISTTFAFVSGCLVGTSIMTPIYAAIAGFMCIKVYRRMTG